MPHLANHLAHGPRPRAATGTACGILTAKPVDLQHGDNLAMRTFRNTMRSMPFMRPLYNRTVFPVPYVLARYRKHRRLTSGYAVGFAPDRPAVYPVVYKMCLVSGHRVVDGLRASCDVAIRWEISTFFDERPELNSLAETTRVLNLNFLDSSKRTLDDAHQEIFGYRLNVDPTTYQGQGVRKSNTNALHDGQEIDLPITVSEVDPDVVYQRRIDNVAADGLVEDIRIPVFGGHIPFAYLKYRPQASRFTNKNAYVKIVELDTVLSQDEQARVVGLCQRLGLDYGELDTLRDRQDGRLYVVDMNNTPSGPPNGLSKLDRWIALDRLAEAFTSTFLRHEQAPM